jgi:hypothetical protein
MMLSITGASSPEKIRHNSREVRRSKLRHDEAGRQHKENVLLKLLDTNDDAIPMTFANLVCNRKGYKCNDVRSCTIAYK